jgi:hypothetical protein
LKDVTFIGLTYNKSGWHQSVRRTRSSTAKETARFSASSAVARVTLVLGGDESF